MYGDGNYLRDYLHIDDAVDAFIRAGKISNDESVNLFNIGTGKGTSLGSALQLIVDLANVWTGRKSKLVSIDFPANAYEVEKRNSVVDASSFINLTGWSPKVDFKNGVRTGLSQAYTFRSEQ
jgi:nucleoside-diphosphate-sugar epimerase